MMIVGRRESVLRSKLSSLVNSLALIFCVLLLSGWGKSLSLAQEQGQEQQEDDGHRHGKACGFTADVIDVVGPSCADGDDEIMVGLWLCSDFNRDKCGCFSGGCTDADFYKEYYLNLTQEASHEVCDTVKEEQEGLPVGSIHYEIHPDDIWKVENAKKRGKYDVKVNLYEDDACAIDQTASSSEDEVLNTTSSFAAGDISNGQIPKLEEMYIIQSIRPYIDNDQDTPIHQEEEEEEEEEEAGRRRLLSLNDQAAVGLSEECGFDVDENGKLLPSCARDNASLITVGLWLCSDSGVTACGCSGLDSKGSLYEGGERREGGDGDGGGGEDSCTDADAFLEYTLELNDNEHNFCDTLGNIRHIYDQSSDEDDGSNAAFPIGSYMDANGDIHFFDEESGDADDGFTAAIPIGSFSYKVHPDDEWKVDQYSAMLQREGSPHGEQDPSIMVNFYPGDYCTGGTAGYPYVAYPPIEEYNVQQGWDVPQLIKSIRPYVYNHGDPPKGIGIKFVSWPAFDKGVPYHYDELSCGDTLWVDSAGNACASAVDQTFFLGDSRALVPPYRSKPEDEDWGENWLLEGNVSFDGNYDIPQYWFDTHGGLPMRSFMFEVYQPYQEFDSWDGSPFIDFCSGDYIEDYCLAARFYRQNQDPENWYNTDNMIGETWINMKNLCANDGANGFCINTSNGSTSNSSSGGSRCLDAWLTDNQGTPVEANPLYYDQVSTKILYGKENCNNFI